MKEKKHGGKRRNSGRKPVEDKKIPVILYIPNSAIQAHGGLDKLREKLIFFSLNMNEK